MPKIYGHRGAAAYAPENTMSAFMMARQMGADGIELDVQLTADGEVVVIHDDELRRTTGARGRASDYTLEKLKKLDAGSFYSLGFKGERIPMLDEVLDFLKTTELELNIEIKSSAANYKRELVESVNRKIMDSGLLGRIIVSSFDHKCLAGLKELNPKLAVGLLYSARLCHPGEYAHLAGAQAIHPFYGNLDREDVEECHKLGILVNPWTVDDALAIDQMVSFGVDTIITNVPDKARR